MLENSDMIFAIGTGGGALVILAFCAGLCCWRDAQRRSRWDLPEDDPEEAASSDRAPPSIHKPGQKGKGKGKGLDIHPDVDKPLLPTGYDAPSRRLDAYRWRRRGNNAQSKFARVTAVAEISSNSDDKAFRAFGALSATQEDGAATPRSSRSQPSARSKEGVKIEEWRKGTAPKFEGVAAKDVELGRKEKGARGVGSNTTSKSSSSRPGGSAGTTVAPRRESELSNPENGDADTSKAGQPPRVRTMSAETQAALARAKPGSKAREKPLVKVRPPPLLNPEPTALGKGALEQEFGASRQQREQLRLAELIESDAQAWPVPGLPPPPQSPQPVQGSPLPPTTAAPSQAFPAAPTTPPPELQAQGTAASVEIGTLQWRGHPVPSKEAPPPRPPSSLPPVPLVGLLPNGGDIFSQIELPASPPRPGRSASPKGRDSESEALKREEKFRAMDAELCDEVEAEVGRAVDSAFDSKALQRSSSGMRPARPGSNVAPAVPDKGAKRGSSPKDRHKTPKKKGSGGQEA